jgi:hypothetical protein
MAGRLNLSVAGIEDAHLTGQPGMSYFLTRFKRHASFAFEIVENQFDGVNNYGNLITSIIPSFHGDLIKNLTFKLARKPLAPNGTSWSPSFMTRLVEFAELYIGGQLIEKITGEYIYLYQQLRNNDYDTRQTLYFLTGHGDLLDYYEDEYIYFLDLPFHFYRNPKLAIPICALSKQNVEVRIKLRNFNEVILDPNSYGGEISRLSLNVEYVYLNPEERAYLMSTEINHPITQVQLTQFKMKTGELKKDVLLNFEHPVKEMYFVSQSNVSSESNFTNQYNKIKRLELKVNNETLFSKEGKEVGYDHTLERYINSPIASEFGGPIEIDERKFGPSTFGLHSFALHPTESGSSGYINMSRIIHKLLSLEIEPLSNINTNTLITQIVTEDSSTPYTLTTENQVPFTDTETITTEAITTTPVTVTKNVTTKKERVDTTIITTPITRQIIGLASNDVIGTATTSPGSPVIRTKNEPVITTFVSEIDGSSTTTTSSQSTTITKRGSGVSTPTFALGQRNVNSTSSVSFSNTFIRTGTVPFTPTSTESVFTDVPDAPSTTTTPTRVLGDPNELLSSSVTLPEDENTLSTTNGTLTNVDDTENVSESSGLTTSGSDKIFKIGNPSDTGDPLSTLIGVTITSSGGVTTLSTGGSGSFPSGFIPVSLWYKVYAPTATIIDDVSDYSFDLETENQKYGNICHISKDSSRIITTHGTKAQVPIHIYRYISEVTVDNTTLTNIFGKEYIKSYNNSTTSDDVRYLDFSFNQNTTNLDGSVCAASYYNLNGTYVINKDLSGLGVTGTGVAGSDVNTGYDIEGTRASLLKVFPSYDGNENVGGIDYNGALSIDSNSLFLALFDTRAPSYPSSYTSPYDFYNGWSWSAFVLEDYRRAESGDFYVPGGRGGQPPSAYRLADSTFFHGWKWYSRHDNKLWEYQGAGTWTELTIPSEYNEITQQYTTASPFNLTSGPNETHINVMRYTESFEADSIGNGDWSTIEQLYQPSNTPNMHFGHSMSMNSLGNRLAVSGVVFPDIQTTNANIVVIYDYTNSSWTSTTIQLPTQTGNYGVQVALTGDGNTLCVSMHGNDTGTINCDGRLFLYTYVNNAWSLSEELDLPTPDPTTPSRSMFGRSIAISDDAEKIIVGAPNWDGGRAFLYCLIDGQIHEIEPNGSTSTNFGHRVDISSDGEKIIIGSRTGPVEIWSHEDCTTDATFVSSQNLNGNNKVTDVSINQDGSRFVYSSQDSERIYVHDDRVASAEISFSSGDFFTEEDVETTTSSNGNTRTETNRVRTLPPYKVPIEEVSFDEIETVETITPFDSVQEVQEQKERVETVVTTRDIITTGVENSTTTEVGIRNATDITATKSLTTTPIIVDQEHDTRVYAVNHNILSVRDGLAGLRF